MTFAMNGFGPALAVRRDVCSPGRGDHGRTRNTAIGVIRKLWSVDAELYGHHLLRLDPESRRNRFTGSVSDDYLRAYAGAWRGLDRVSYGFFAAGTLRGAAELRATGDRTAEAAFSIEKPWQSHGVGTTLLGRLLLAARNRSYRRLHMVCLADNRAMQHLAAKFAADLSVEFGTSVGELEAPPATPISLFREMMADGSDMALAMLAQSRPPHARSRPV